MNKWIYTNENIHKVPNGLKEILASLESKLVKIFFLKTDIKYNYEVEIQHFSRHYINSPEYWIRVKMFLASRINKKFTLMTLYCIEERSYPCKIQANYIYDNLIEIQDEYGFLEFLESIFINCFLEMNSYLEYYNEEFLLDFNKSAICLEHTKNELLDLKRTTTRWKRWTQEEKWIIIENIPLYRKKIYDSDKSLVKEITNKFAINLFKEYNSIFEERTVSAIANRLAYFDELLAGVNTKYAKIDRIYFEKLKRLDGDMTENPARRWRD